MHKKKTQDYWWLQYQKSNSIREKYELEKIHEKKVEAIEAFQRSQIPFTEDIKREAE